MKQIYIKQHMGLGDNIVCNGMVRKIAQDNPNCEIIVPVRQHNAENVIRMFRDNNKIIIDSFNDIDYRHMGSIVDKRDYYKIMSCCVNPHVAYRKYFDDAFYLEIGMSPNVKKDYFYIQRDEEKENIVFEEMIIKKGIKDYIFLHEKSSDNIIIDRKRLPNLPIVYADPNYAFFDLLKVIEKATECHLISSSFVSLMTCEKFNPNTFVHMYADRAELTNYIKENGLNVLI